MLNQRKLIKPNTNNRITLGALSDLVHQGKVRYIGSSSYAGSQIVEAQWVARERNLLARLRSSLGDLARHIEQAKSGIEKRRSLMLAKDLGEYRPGGQKPVRRIR